MKHIYILIVWMLALIISGQAQDFTYDVTPMEPVARAGISPAPGVAPDYGEHVMRLAPLPGGEQARHLLDIAKEQVALRYPHKDGGSMGVTRSQVESPRMGSHFPGPNQALGIPLDTHIGVSDSGQVVAVVNFEMVVYDTAGNVQRRRTLANLFQGTITSVFDPKVHYDPEEDRWILIALAYTGSVSHIYMAFSQTNDAAGEFNLYTLNGDPFNTSSFFDYPMASISHDELFLTGNSVIRGEPWQTGFVETLIYQIDKQTGYAGDSLEFYVWSNLTLLGSKLRNLCPVKGATGNYGPNHYFLSNRNFDVQNDTILLLQIWDTMAVNLPFITMDLLKSDQAYGAPPNARQLSPNTLATNDARVLDALIFNDRIQFVGNTVNTANGFPAIYYGVIDSVAANPQVSGSIISSDTLEFGYPSIAYVGSGDPQINDQDVVIFADYSENLEFPGTGAWYMDSFGQLSDFSIAKTGEFLINVLRGNDERWGDYTGCQRKYNAPGEVWTMGTFGLADGADGIANAYITQWMKPGLATSAKKPQPEKLAVDLYPNPANDRVYLDFLVKQGEQVEIGLYDLQGRRLEQFFSYPAGRGGEHRFSFDTTPLPSGAYMLRIEVAGAPAAVKKFVVN